MSDVGSYRKNILRIILDNVEPIPEVMAAWEGGSAANGTLDQYSDIDLCVLAKTPLQSVMDKIETALEVIGIDYGWQAKKSFFGEGMIQKVIVLKDSPKYFSVDVSIFDLQDTNLLKEFLEVERHGVPRVLFDKENLIKPRHTDPEILFRQHQERVEQIAQAFPIFKTLVLKEIARGHEIDAIGFYQNALVRPLIEVLGMIYRPFQADFGMRYVHSSFPPELQKLITNLNYVASFEDLPAKVMEAEEAFHRAVELVREKTEL
ncbi:MAG: nucleotidyltransferase domain-containing protein [Bdellovibrionales bacterium]|nr:nucleotidyltransferase domain-containing protein [Bdellovibrionales bacterium]